jgi:hypothetical protein
MKNKITSPLFRSVVVALLMLPLFFAFSGYAQSSLEGHYIIIRVDFRATNTEAFIIYGGDRPEEIISLRSATKLSNEGKIVYALNKMVDILNDLSKQGYKLIAVTTEQQSFNGTGGVNGYVYTLYKE